MAPMTNKVKVQKYFQGLTIETNNFAFQVKVILGLLTIETNNFAFEAKVIVGLKNTGPDGQKAKKVEWFLWPIVLR